MSAAPQLAREYELVYILRPNVGPSEAKKVSDRITDVIDKGGAKLTRVDNWGKRKLAYQIQKHTRGVFVYVTFVAPTGLVSELERNLRILDPVIRYQTVRLENLYDLSELSVDPDEVEFVEIEASDDEDEDPTFEEQLGMSAPRPAPVEAPAEPAKAEGEAAEGEKAEGEKAEGEAAEGEAAEGEKAEGEKAEAAEGETAEAAADDSSTEKEG